MEHNGYVIFLFHSYDGIFSKNLLYATSHHSQSGCNLKKNANPIHQNFDARKFLLKREHGNILGGTSTRREGFKGRRSSGMRSRASFCVGTASSFPFHDKHKADSRRSFSGQRTTKERTRSELLKCKERSTTGRCSRDVKEKLCGRSNLMHLDRLGLEGTQNVHKHGMISVGKQKEIEEIETEEISQERGEKIRKDICFDKGCGLERSKQSVQGRVDLRDGGKLNEYLQKYSGSDDRRRIIAKQAETSRVSDVRDTKCSQFGVEDEHQRPKNKDDAPIPFEVALDEVALQAIVSILNGYIKQFFKDEGFRSTLHMDCFSSFGVPEMKQGHRVESKVINTLEHAIEVVEKVAIGTASTKDLKKASLQLGVISRLSSNELTDGHTSGVPNSTLSACAHLYLSVIYKLQKRDRIAAKHLLQVFCDSPFLARSLLLPGLWEYLFSPHLTHLRVWHNREVGSLQNSPSMMRKLELLDKVYNEILDSGTYQFAAYYMIWLTEGVDAPSVPSISIPTRLMSVKEVHVVDSQDRYYGLDSPYVPFSPQPMVSKKLYDAMFGRLIKPGDHKAESSREVDNFDNYANFSDGSTSEVKETQLFSTELVKSLYEDKENISSNDADEKSSPPDNHMFLESKEDWKLIKESVSTQSDHIDETSNSNVSQAAAGDSQSKEPPSNKRSNKIALECLAKSAFRQQETIHSGDETICTLTIPKVINVKDAYKEIHERYGHLNEELSIPQYFICPLTGLLFEEPVTLETGETFEREAITKWFEKGKWMCPVTRRSLQSKIVPFTNTILKRVIDGWKLKHCSNLLTFASKVVIGLVGYESKDKEEAAVAILEQLLMRFKEEERKTNAKCLVAIGGLEFLIMRFKLGDLEEKACATTLLLCCVEADLGCRNQIVESIDKYCLFELLHSIDPKIKWNVARLLIEFVSLSRKKDSAIFLSGFASEDMENIMHTVLVYLQSLPLEERPSIAVLLLQMYLLVGHVLKAEPERFNVYREEAVDDIAMALEGSVTDDKIREQCCKALLILGGRFSASGKFLTESWILKQAGFTSGSEFNKTTVITEPDEHTPLEDGEDEKEWIRNLTATLLGHTKRAFLDALSKCLGSKNLELVRACLITVAWLSGALAPLSDADFHIPTFSALVFRLKESLENGEQTELKVLASVSLLNFGEIPECRMLLMTIAEDIAAPLRNIAKVTWTARQLYSTIGGEDPLVNEEKLLL